MTPRRRPPGSSAFPSSPAAATATQPELWEPALGRIIARRSQLRSRALYAATLLHELGHVQSGAGDVSWEFKDGLTGLLGTVAQPALRR